MRIKSYAWLLIILLGLSRPAIAEDWRDQMEYLIYSPRYFGPNAFPIPELTGINVSWVFQEWYKTSTEVRDERHAVETESPIVCRGDVVLNCFYQVLRSERWLDVAVSANLKTASGGRLCDARYTDAASYWFTAELGRDLWKDEAHEAFLRAQAQAGFYCWMTNDMVHRQNDAFCYGVGLSGGVKGFSLDCDYSGIQGYENIGDRPMIVRTNLSYEIKKNIISFHFGLGYTRCF